MDHSLRNAAHDRVNSIVPDWDDYTRCPPCGRPADAGRRSPGRASHLRGRGFPVH